MTERLEARVTADTTGFQAGMVQAAEVTDAQMRRIKAYVMSGIEANARLERQARASAATAEVAYAKVSEGAEKMSHAHAGVTRELLVLTHEMSQGNFKRFGGSMLVLAERVDALKFVMTATGAATFGASAALVGFVALAAKGAIDAAQFGRELQLTGNYAAVTAQQIANMAAAQAKYTGQTVGGSRESLQTVAGSGLFTPAAFADVARAMGDYQRLSGKNAEESLKMFERLQDGVAKWAAEENRSMHFLTLGQYEHIKALEDAGRQEEAVQAAMRAMSDTLESRAVPAVGLLAREWQAVTQWASRAVNAMESVGRPETIANQIEAIDRQLDMMQKAASLPGKVNPFGSPGMLPATDRNMDLLREQRRMLANASAMQSATAQYTAQKEAIDALAIKSRQYTDEILRGAKAMSARTAELEKWDAAVKAQAAAGKPMSEADAAAGRAEIEKRFTPHAAMQQENEYRGLIATIDKFNATTGAQVSAMAKATEGQRFMMDVTERLARAHTALTAAQERQVLVQARAAAAARDLINQEQRDAELRRKVVEEEAVRQAKTEQEQYGRMSSFVERANDQANALIRSMDLIGKTSEQAFRIQQIEHFDDALRKALAGAKSASEAAEIQRVAVVLRGDLTQALDAVKDAHDRMNMSFERGIDKAMASYVQTAQNSAAQAEKFFNDSMAHMTDALTKFATTGKWSWKGLVDSMINEMLRMQITKGLGGLFGRGGISLDVLGSLGKAIIPTFADGLSYVPYDGYPAVLHEGESVIRRQDANLMRQGGGHTFQFSNEYHIGEGVSRADVAAAVQLGNAQLEASLRRDLRNGYVVIG